MTQLHAVSPSRHAEKSWSPSAGYQFAGTQTLAPLAAAEWPKALFSLPMALHREGEAYVPVAVLGLERGHNLFVRHDGHWVGGYVPAALRSYPFRLARAPERTEGEWVLAVDEASGLVHDGAEGRAFFDENGKPTEEIQRLLRFLKQTHASHLAARKAAAALDRHGIIRPWEVAIDTPNGKHGVKGLYRVDEKAFNALEADALAELRDAGALNLAYCLLYSQHRLPMLGKLMQAHQRQVPASDDVPGNLDAFFDEDDDLEFDFE
ncbi:peptidase [Halomonas alkaliantarctica]|nr:peptidase [Halomonas alkaliantarctica]